SPSPQFPVPSPLTISGAVMRIRVIVTLMLACAPLQAFAQPAHLVKDIFNVSGAAGSLPQKFARVGSTTFFAASDTANGTELWKTDGTAAGTMLVRDIQLGPNSSAPDCLQSYQGKLVFIASEESTGTQLWQSDGTAVGTTLLVTIGASVGGAQLAACPLQINGLLIFKVAGPFASVAGLWRTDGTEAGTFRVGAWASFNPINFAISNGIVYFAVGDPSTGSELWRTDGSAAGTYLVKDVN